MDINSMLNLNQIGEQGQLQATGSVLGGVVGVYFGNPLLGAQVGGAIGTVVSNFIPQHTYIKGSVTGVNFTNLNIKPYTISLVTPNAATAKQISDYYCYFGCKTNKTEALNIGSYMYNNHAFVRGELEYNGSVPLDKFSDIQNMFRNGVHILNG